MRLASHRGIGADGVRSIVDRGCRTLLARRGSRVRPAVDDKVVTAWNGLVLRSLAEAGRILGDAAYLDAARSLAVFAASELVDDIGRPVRTWRHGRQGPAGFCDDYAALAIGMFALHAATAERRWYEEGIRLTRLAVTSFADPDGGFFATAADAEPLIARPKNLFDNPTPSDNSLMAEALQIAVAYTGDAELAAARDEIHRVAGRLAEQHPTAVCHLLAVLATGIAGIDEIAIVGEPETRAALEDVVWERFRPAAVLTATTSPAVVPPLLEGRLSAAEGPQAYVCRRFTCQTPVTDPAELRRLLDD